MHTRGLRDTMDILVIACVCVSVLAVVLFLVFTPSHENTSYIKPPTLIECTELEEETVCDPRNRPLQHEGDLPNNGEHDDGRVKEESPVRVGDSDDNENHPQHGDSETRVETTSV